MSPVTEWALLLMAMVLVLWYWKRLGSDHASIFTEYSSLVENETLGSQHFDRVRLDWHPMVSYFAYRPKLSCNPHWLAWALGPGL